jgi:hypothetical protein
MRDAPITDPRVDLATKRTKLASFRTAQALDRTTLVRLRETLEKQFPNICGPHDRQQQGRQRK